MNGGSVAAYPLSKPPHDPLTTQPLHIPAKRPAWPTAYPHVSNFCSVLVQAPTCVSLR